jgi:hypothetical protein
MTLSEDDVQGSDDPHTVAPDAEATSQHPEQEHAPQDAHGGSMAPGLVDDIGHPVEEEAPGSAQDQADHPDDAGESDPLAQ